MKIPSSLRAGDTWEWTDSLTDYPAATYTLKYALRYYGLTKIDIVAVANGNDHDISVSASETSAFEKGNYDWVAFVEWTISPGITGRKTIDEGMVTIKPYMPGTSSSTDHRSHAKKMLDAIEATLQGRATHADLSLTINGRAIQYLKPDELLRLRGFYRSEVDTENGKTKTIRVKFGSA